MASLEMMNSLAADLPTSFPAFSPLRRSYTLNPKRLTRSPGGGREGREVTRKPPLPKLSLVVPPLVSPSESQTNISSYSTLPPSLPSLPLYRQSISGLLELAYKWGGKVQSGGAKRRNFKHKPLF